MSAAFAARGGGFILNYSDGRIVMPDGTTQAVGASGVTVGGVTAWLGTGMGGDGLRSVQASRVLEIAGTAWPQGGGVSSQRRATPRLYVEPSTTTAEEQARDSLIVFDHFRMLSRELRLHEVGDWPNDFLSPGYCREWLRDRNQPTNQIEISDSIDVLLAANLIGHGRLREVKNPRPNPADDRRQPTRGTSAIHTSGVSADVPYIITFNDEGPALRPAANYPDERSRYDRLTVSLHELGHHRKVLLPDAGDTAQSEMNSGEVRIVCGALMSLIDTTYPRVSRMSTRSGPVGGGTVVVIEGAAFEAGLRVEFGGIQATAVQLRADGKIEVTTPSVPAAGRRDVNVILPDGRWGRNYEGFEFKN